MNIYPFKKVEATTFQKRLDNVYVIASGKGGVGKTWYSVSMAHAMAELGKRVLLFDGDLGLANIDIQLGIMPEYDLSDYFQGRVSLSETRLTLDTVSNQDGRIDVITGRSGSGSLANLPYHQKENLIESLYALSNHYDYVLIDLAAGVDENILQVTNIAGHYIVIVTPEPTSMTDSYAFIKIITLQGEGDRVSLLVNQADHEKEANTTYATLKKTCDHFLDTTPPLLGFIQKDKRVREAIKSQKPIGKRFPNAKANDEVLRLAKKVIQSRK